MVVTAVMVGVVMCGCGGGQRRDEEASVTQPKPEEPTPPIKTGKDLSGTVEDGVRVVHMTAANWVFEPDEIVVKQGEPVKLIIDSEDDTTYGFNLKGMGIEAELPPKKEVTVEFTPGEVGDFVFRSTIGPGVVADSKGKASEMRGRLFVISPQS